jgi:hypothetical protein
MSPETRAQEYRRQAEECRLQAERSLSNDDKARWLKIAAQWQYMAESLELASQQVQRPQTEAKL